MDRLTELLNAFDATRLIRTFVANWLYAGDPLGLKSTWAFFVPIDAGFSATAWGALSAASAAARDTAWTASAAARTAWGALSAARDAASAADAKAAASAAASDACAGQVERLINMLEENES